MHVAHLALHDFRSYAQVEVPLTPGSSVFVGANGQGKTNLVEAVDYLATLASHRVATDAPLVRAGASQAVVRASVVREDRQALLELEINPGRSNRARVNKSPLPRAREILGWLRCVIFSPEDLALVKGDPSGRRDHLDALLVLRSPRFAAVRAEYDRVVRQRNTLLKTAGPARRSGGTTSALATLEVWDDHLVRTGAELLAARLALVDDLRPHLAQAYAGVAAHADPGRTVAGCTYKPSLELPGDMRDREALAAALAAEVASRRGEELDRGVGLVGPHRDDLVLSVGDLPAKGYASHGESWSLALSLQLAAYALVRADGDDPVLVLDDVFAELDRGRRDQLAAMVASAEQVLVTAAVADDVPEALSGQRYLVHGGAVTRA